MGLEKTNAPNGALALITLAICRLQRLDARRFLVVHDEGAVVQPCDAGVELAQQLESLPTWRDWDAFLEASLRILPSRFRNFKIILVSKPRRS